MSAIIITRLIKFTSDVIKDAFKSENADKIEENADQIANMKKKILDFTSTNAGKLAKINAEIAILKSKDTVEIDKLGTDLFNINEEIVDLISSNQDQIESLKIDFSDEIKGFETDIAKIKTNIVDLKELESPTLDQIEPISRSIRNLNQNIKLFIKKNITPELKTKINNIKDEIYTVNYEIYSFTEDYLKQSIAVIDDIKSLLQEIDLINQLT